MSYLYDGSATTQKGKIIYRRKKHLFGPCDLLRLTMKIERPKGAQGFFCYLYATQYIAREWSRSYFTEVAKASSLLFTELTNLENVLLEDPEFGGGEYGGGGVSRPF